MLTRALLALLLLALSAEAFLNLPFLTHIAPAAEVRAFKAANITPAVIPVFKPTAGLAVTFFFNETLKNVELGTNFTMPTANRPIFSVQGTQGIKPEGKFVITMVDPDALTPQDPNEAQIRHFVGGGFRLAGPPTDFGTFLFNTTPAISDFVQPQPPTTSDPHRYIFLLFNEPADFPTTIGADITHFNVTAFAEQFGLGEPLAGNFMTVSTMPGAVITDP